MDDFYVVEQPGLWTVHDPSDGSIVAKCDTRSRADVVCDALNARAELISVWPLGGYELEAFCDATVMPLLLGKRPETREAPDADFAERAAPLMAEPLDGWAFTYEYPGAWCWSHAEKRLVVYATPFWDGQPGIPVQYSTFEDSNPLGGALIPFELCGDLAADVAAYREAIRPHLAKLT